MVSWLRNDFCNVRCWVLRGKAIAIAAIVLLGHQSARATDPGQVVADGKFFLGQPKAPFTGYKAGQKFGGWTVEKGTVNACVDYYATPDEQSYSLELNGTSPGAIRQVLKTEKDKTYTLTFLMSGNWVAGRGSRSLALTAGPLKKTISIERPENWSRNNMNWKLMTFQFKAKEATTELVFVSTTRGAAGPVIADVSARSPVDPPDSLDTIPVPLPPDLDEYVADKKAAILLGKALFWDMQVGGDGKTACASCHWHAGADARTRNTLHPGAPGSAFGPQSDKSHQLEEEAIANFRGANVDLNSDDFPFLRLEDMDRRRSSENQVTFDTMEVVGSQGVVSNRFIEIIEGNPEDRGEITPHPIFNVDGTNVRQVTGRNSPTTINAVFFDRSFWDGRANRYFNGVNPFGDLDPDARVLKLVSSNESDQDDEDQDGGKTKTKNKKDRDSNKEEKTKCKTGSRMEPVRVLIDNAALASQAVGPPNNSVEMSWDGRNFRELARKMFSLRPLALQKVDEDDSVLGSVVDECGTGLDPEKAGYAALIRKSFQPEWWSATDLTEDGYTQMEANFSLFWGLSIMMYESTLVSDETPFDEFRKGDKKALSDAAKRGLSIFLNEGKCINCHGGPEFAGGTVSQLRGVLSDEGPVEFMAMARGVAFYDSGFYNIGVRQTEEDIGVGASHPLFGPLSYSKQRQDGRNIGQDVSVPEGARIAVNGAFKTPTLRNIELTGPYFHNGGQKDLMGVVKFYTRGADFHDKNREDLDPDVGGIPELRDNEEDQRALVEFMLHLTDQRVKYQKAPFDHPEIVIPNGHRGIRNGVALDNNLTIPATGKKGGNPFMPFEEALESGY